MEIKKVCVVGGGLMGRQIALNTAIYNYEVILTDNNPAVLDNVQAWMDEYLAGRLKKGRMTSEQVDGIRSRMRLVGNLAAAVQDADLVIEAVVEIENVKRDLLKEISDLVRPDTILATNSSYLVSSRFKDVVSNPERLINLHYFNPALVMKLTEIVQGEHCSAETATKVFDFAVSTGKTPILMKKEIEGFVVNRILEAIYAEARFLVSEGYCSPEDVDTACEKGLNYPMGPFRLNDLSGVDLSLNIMKRQYAETGIKPVGYDLYEDMVAQGRFGKKCGRGFYEYTD